MSDRRASDQRYNASDKGQARYARYEASEKGQLTRAHYEATMAGILNRIMCGIRSNAVRRGAR